MIAQAARRSSSLSPVGTGSSLRWLPPSDERVQLISSRALGKIIEYDPADLTVTVESGCLVSDLQQALAANGQFLPLDRAAGTVGGAIACGASGALALGYGALRDRILRVRAITAVGEMTVTGSKVVKSVAGFDLAKVYCGSFGTLVFIVEATFKVAPLPQGRQLLCFSGEIDAVDSWTRTVLCSRYRPVALQVFNSLAVRNRAGEANPTSAFLVAARLLGRHRAVERQATTLRATAAGETLTETKELTHQGIESLDDVADSAESAVIITVQESELLSALGLATRAGLPACAEFGSNRLRVWSEQGGLNGLPQTLWRALADPTFPMVVRDGGKVEWRRRLDPRARDLTLEVKKALDPNDLFQPGLLPRLLGT